MKVWYFTTGNKLRSIMRRGHIPPEDIDAGKSVRSAVVCSTNPDGDGLESVSVLEFGEWRSMSREELGDYAGGLFRIEVDSSDVPLTWNDWVTQSGITRKDARQLRQSLGADKQVREQWRLSFDPIPESAWIEIWKWIDGHWTIWDRNRDDLKPSSDVIDVGDMLGGDDKLDSTV